MKFCFRSIRAKLWLCVAIVLLGYFVATVVGFYVNVYQYNRLSHLQALHIPLTSLGNEILTRFEQQTEEYEDAFLLAERELSEQAAQMDAGILNKINALIRATQTHKESPVGIERLQSIKQNYLEFTQLAAQIHTRISNETFSDSSQQEIQHFGEVQRKLDDEFHSLAAALNNSMLLEVEQHKSRALNSIIMLCLLFMTVLLLVALSVGRVSDTLLVAPLKKVQENVERFEHGHQLIKPDREDTRDEIAQLATAFWNMTERLGKTTVSKNYVDNIINNMSGALVVLRPDFTINKVNPQALELFESTEEELIGSPLIPRLACNPNDQNSATQLKQLFCGESIHNTELFAIGKTGRKVPLHFSGTPMYDDDNHLSALICLLDDVTELKQAESKLKQMAHHDSLTGLPNRNLFFDRLEHALLDAKRHGRIFALLYLDLDKFKPINDSLGHEFGDKALQEIGRRLQNALRGDDTVARVGGDEFIIILNGLQNIESTATLAEKIILTIVTPIQIGSLSHQLGVSVGISVFPSDGKDIDTLISQADKAMYVAKKHGGNGYSGAGYEYVRCENPAEREPC